MKGSVEELYVIPDNESEATFRSDHLLPSLPLPALEDTLKRYLDSVKPLVTNEEFEDTKSIVEKFSKTDGAYLHAKLQKKAASERNWVERWWEDYAYLQVRAPLVPFCSMDGVFPKSTKFKWSYSSIDDQIYNGALYFYGSIYFWQLLRDEKLRPTKSVDQKTTFSMSQFRRLYNTVRIPGKQIDSLVSHFKTKSEGACPSHVIILCRGRIFRVDVYDCQGNLLLPSDWQIVFKDVLSKCSSEGDGVGLFTVDNRDSWAENRFRLSSLSEKNAQYLKEIDTAVSVVTLDEETPLTDSDVTHSNLCGKIRDRWADKSILTVIYSNGRIGGNCDHTAYDGLCSVIMMHYVYLMIEEWNGLIPEKLKGNSKAGFELPKELKFDLDEPLRLELSRIKQNVVEKNIKQIRMTRETFNWFGKNEIQRWKLHPDYTMQMALQLAYMRLHGKPAPCYETATTRGYYNGRTETVRSCSVECVEWVKSMMNLDVKNDVRRDLLKKAVQKQDELMRFARDNAGCDRHLFGLYCTALEEGLPIPKLYSDPAYTKSGGGGNFILSTSLTGYTPIGGGVAPMCLNGYGVFYCFSPNSITATVSTDTRSEETDAAKMFAAISTSLLDIRKLMAGSVQSKL